MEGREGGDWISFAENNRMSFRRWKSKAVGVWPHKMIFRLLQPGRVWHLEQSPEGPRSRGSAVGMLMRQIGPWLNGCGGNSEVGREVGLEDRHVVSPDSIVSFFQIEENREEAWFVRKSVFDIGGKAERGQDCRPWFSESVLVGGEFVVWFKVPNQTVINYFLEGFS